VAVIGVGAMGAHHAENLARHTPGARLIGLADPQPGLAERHAASLGCSRWTLDYEQLLADPAVEAVVIATPARYHGEAIVAAAQAGKAVFCEKPIANELADAVRSIAAARAAGVPFQIGFQRRFDPAYIRARGLVDSGDLGRIQLLRSLTRDPKLDDPGRVPPGAIFRETLIHDFDVLRFLAGGAEPVEVYAIADALVRPDWKSRGLLDSAVVSLRYDSGALGTADSSFQAVYGYDVRAEVFGSDGMATVGDSSPINLVHHNRLGSTQPRPHWFVDVFGEAYAAELAHFVARVRVSARPEGGSQAAAAGSAEARLSGGSSQAAAAGSAEARLSEGSSQAAAAGSAEARPGGGSSQVAAAESAEARLGGGSPSGHAASGEDGRAALAIALAAMKSVETGRPVRIAEITP
jgi:myo-inositol 2-dehydrogenase/D-chiro-inositol 1-dehydrogenase